MIPNDRKIAEAIARLIAGRSDYKTECAALNLKRRTLERYVAETRKLAKLNPPPAGGDTPSPEPPPPDESNALKKAKEGAGLAPKPSETPGGAPPVSPAQALKSMQDFCVDTIENWSGGLGEMYVGYRFSPPLSTADPKVQELLHLGRFAKATIIANAERLYPFCMKAMNGWGPLGAALAFDFNNRMNQLKGMAIEKGWQPKPSPGAGAPPAPPSPVPPPHPAGSAAAAVEADRARKVQEFEKTLDPATPVKPGGQIIDVPT